jgi:hypothetical protein
MTSKTELYVIHYFRLYSLKKTAVAVKELSEIGDEWMDFDVIGIDEGQFFSDVSNAVLT